jgi:hypothetical protein
MRAATIILTALLTCFTALAQTGEPETAPKGGIHIHGHWVIDVKAPGGAIRSHREFENSYVGAYFMPLLLGGYVSNADPAIVLYSANNGAGSFCNGGFSGNQCVIVGSSTAGQGAVDNCSSLPDYCYGGLAVNLTPAAAGYSSMVLAVSLTAATNGTFDTVSTTITNCWTAPLPASYAVVPATVSSGQCFANAAQYLTTSGVNVANTSLTSRILNPAISVTAGEIVTFQITLSFS